MENINNGESKIDIYYRVLINKIQNNKIQTII